MLKIVYDRACKSRLVVYFANRIQVFYIHELKALAELFGAIGKVGFKGSTIGAKGSKLSRKFPLQCLSRPPTANLGEILGCHRVIRHSGTVAILSGLIVLGFTGQQAQALPTGYQGVQGGISFSQSGNVLNINTTTQRAIANYQTFNVAAGETVNFNLPNSASAILNRVIGGTSSSIFGNINSNGQVFLINPSGILFGRSSQVNVGSLFASTLNISDQNFMAGNLVFTKDPNAAPASVINLGNIQIQKNGSAVLLASAIDNEGTINAPEGQIHLAVGDQITVSTDNSGVVMDITVDEALKQKVDALQAAISNSGTLQADGGVIQLQAQLSSYIQQQAINNSGIVQAKGFNTTHGTVEFVANAGSGTEVLNTGTIDVRGDQGGTIEVLGDYVALGSGSSIDASGNVGGGTVLIGGDSHGEGPTQTAIRTYVDPNATIKADALTEGNGGKVVVWSDDTTWDYGSISARGGSQSGNGGQVEVSGKQNLEMSGQVNTLAPHGNAGDLLLDPLNIAVVASGGSNTISDVSSFTSQSGNSTSINASVINSQTSNVTLQATNDINFNAPISITNAGTSLIAQANNNINVNANIATSGGAISLLADNDGNGVGTLTIASGQTVRSNNAAISLSGSALSLAGSVNAGTASVTITSNATNRAIRIGATSANDTTYLDIDSGELSRITAGTLIVGNTATTGGMTLAGNISLATLGYSLTLNDHDDFTQTAGTTISGGTLSLNSTAGNLGTASSILQTAVTSLAANTTGNVYIAQKGNYTLANSSALGANNTFSLTTNGSVTLAGNITTNATSGTVLLASNNSSNFTALSGTTITGGTVSISASSGTIGSSLSPIATSAQTLLLTGNNSTYITQNGNVSLGGDTAAGANKVLSITTTNNGNISVSGNVSVSTGSGSIFLTAGGSGTMSRSNNAFVIGNMVTLASNTGDIGASGTTFQTNANLLSANTSGNVYISQATSLLLGASTGNTLSVSVANTLTSTAVLSATNLILQTNNGSNGSISLQNNVTGTSSVSISTLSNGNIALTSGSISGGAVSISASSGNITLTDGINATGNISLAAGNMSISGSLSGQTVSASAIGNINLSTTIASNGGLISIVADSDNSGGGNATFSGNITSNGGDISLSGSQISNTAGNIIAGAGNIVLTSTDSYTTNTTNRGISLTGMVSGNNVSVSNTLNVTNANITLGQVTASSALNILAQRDLSINGAVSGNTVQIGAAGNINLSSTVTSQGTLNIIADNDNVTNLANDTGGNLVLNGAVNSNGGNISLQGSRVSSVLAGTIASGSGNISITSTNTNSSSANEGVSLSGDISGNKISIGQTDSTSAVFTLANITGNTTIVNNVGNLNINGNVIANTINLNSNAMISISGNVTGVSNVNLFADSDNNSTGDLTVNGAVTSSNGNISLTGDKMSLGILSGNALSLTAYGAVTLNGNVTATQGAAQLTSNDDISLVGNLTAASNITLSADNNINGSGNLLVTGSVYTNNGLVTLYGDNVTLNNSVTGSSISGSAANKFLVNAPLTATNGSISLLGSQVASNISGTINSGANTVSITSANTNMYANMGMTLAGTITGGNINLMDTAITTGDGISLAGVSGSILTASSQGDITLGSPVNVTGAVTLTADSLSVGTGTVYINAALTTTNSAITLTGANVSTTGSLTGSLITASANGGMSIGNTVSGSTVILQTVGNNGNIILNAGVTGNTGVTLSANGSGSISQTAGIVTGGNIILTSATGDIGSSPQSIKIAATTATANTTGNAYLTQANGALNLGASTVGQNLSVSVGNNLTTTGIVSAGTLTLTTGNNSNISLGANVTGNTSVTLNANGSGNITQATGILVTGNSLILASGSGNIGLPSQSINTAANTLTANTIGNAYIAQANGALNLGTSTVGQNLSVSVGNNLTTTGIISAGTLTLTTGNNGNIVLNAVVTGNTSATLNANGSGNITQATGVLVIGNSIILASGSGNIGLPSQSINTAANTLTANTTGNAYIAQANGALNLGTSTVGQNLSVSVGNNLMTTGIVSAGTLTLITGNNGNISLGANITGNTSATLIANGSGNITQVNGVLITGNSLILASGSGNIGLSSQSINTAANTLTANTTGNAYLTQNNGALNLSASTVGQNLNLFVGNNLTTTGIVSAGTLALSTGNNGNISLGASITGNINTTLIANGSGNITQANGVLITGNSILLTSGSGNIGLPSQSISTATNTLTANTTGNAYISQATGALNLGASTVGQNLNVSVGNNLTTTGIVSAGALTLTTGNNGNIVLDATVTGNISATLTANGAGNITQANGVLVTGNSLILASGSGNIGLPSQSINTAANMLTTNTTGNAYIAQANGALNLGASTVGQNLSVSVGNNLTTTGIVSAGTLTLTTGNNGNIVLNAAVTGNTSATLTANGLGNITQANGVLVTGNSLILASGSGNIGLPSQSINTAANTLTANTAGNVYIAQANGALNLGTSTVGQNLNLSVGNNLATAGIVSAGTLTLITGNNGNISLGANITGNTSATLIANGSGNISQSAGKIYSSNLTLTSGNGNIGSGSHAVRTTASILTASTGNSGDVYIQQSGTALTLNGTTTGNNYTLTTNNALQVASNFTISGNLNLNATGQLNLDTDQTATHLSAANITLASTSSTGTIIHNSATTVTAGHTNPVTNLNYTDGQIMPNMTISAAGMGGIISVNGNFNSVGTLDSIGSGININIDYAHSNLSLNGVTLNSQSSGNIMITNNPSGHNGTLTMQATLGNISISTAPGYTVTGNNVTTIASNLNLITDATSLSGQFNNTPISGNMGNGNLSLSSTMGNLVLGSLQVAGNATLSTTGNTNITQTLGSLLTAQSLRFNSDSGNIGLNTQVAGVTGNTSGTVQLTNQGNLQILSTGLTANNIILVNNGNLDLYGTVSGNTVYLSTTGMLVGHTALDLSATQGATLIANGIASQANPLNVSVSGGPLNILVSGQVNGVSGDINGTVSPGNALTYLNNPPGIVYFNGQQSYPVIPAVNLFTVDLEQVGLFAFSDALNRQIVPFFENRDVAQSWINADNDKVSAPQLETDSTTNANGQTVTTISYHYNINKDQQESVPHSDIPVNSTPPEEFENNAHTD